MARLTQKDGIVRRRWSAFLEPVVGREGGRVTVTALAKGVADQTGVTGDIRGELYAYRRGNQTVSPGRAFACGEALRAAGVLWCSGPIALAAAGHIDALVQLFALLPRRSPSHERVAAILAASCAVITGQSDDPEFKKLQQQTRARLARFYPRVADAVGEAWKALCNGAPEPRRGIGFWSSRLRRAHEIASDDGLSFADREADVYSQLWGWVRGFADGNLAEALFSLFAARHRVDTQAYLASDAYGRALSQLAAGDEDLGFAEILDRDEQTAKLIQSLNKPERKE